MNEYILAVCTLQITAIKYVGPEKARTMDAHSCMERNLSIHRSNSIWIYLVIFYEEKVSKFQIFTQKHKVEIYLQKQETKNNKNIVLDN